MRGIQKSYETKRKFSIRTAALLLAVIVWAGALQGQTARAENQCKSLCAAALKATGGSSHLKYKSDHAMDFGGFSVSDRKKVASIMYICDSKEVYSICVVKAKDAASAGHLYKTMKKYQSGNSRSDYLGDYSASEQKVFQNAICGKKGTYVWYIAMSVKKSDNKKGQSAIKKKLG